ncbi:MAG: hypothetical protein CL608_03650 [Anaerolineaceae bacterium]|nr:hypothetical protein [Anaerolineaceae bacterium]
MNLNYWIEYLPNLLKQIPSFAKLILDSPSPIVSKVTEGSITSKKYKIRQYAFVFMQMEKVRLQFVKDPTGIISGFWFTKVQIRKM